MRILELFSEYNKLKYKKKEGNKMIKIIFAPNLKRSIAYDEKEKIGECIFVEEGNQWNITHTEVDNRYQGQGIARELVENIMEEAKANKKEVKATCSYAKKVIKKK